MTLNLISHIEQFNNHYLIISGYSGNYTLSVLDKTLKIITEFSFDNVDIWNANFHIDENKVLISIATTETFKNENTKYQGFNTLWYEVYFKKSILSKQKIIFQHIETWTQSDFTSIKSYRDKNLRYWVGLKQNKKKFKERRTFMNFATTSDLKQLPQLNKPILVHNSAKHKFDFIVSEENLFISIISEKCTLIKTNSKGENIQLQELNIPLKKLHEYADCRLVEIENKVFSYFWTTSQEYSKKYQFELFGTENLKDNFYSGKILKLIDSDFVHSVTWNKPEIVSYKKVFEESKKYYSEINENGKLINEKIIENVTPIHFGFDNDLICFSTDKKELEIIIRK
ncbi:hypothetical protein KO500_00640 [Cellulophaga baltica]|uniref:hypothetical protein n=1 Tax=Cellulophaga TaxID=104264 RepID=UPI001C07177C|nr:MULTISPECIES: hypothetical protein [Cellulophaga]MBU2994919.1 hypothetical protein [Cellulophaga baltica]MDO6766313.1 hypothetical protein [Cellulophaga sp. 1_MG-2023]